MTDTSSRRIVLPLIDHHCHGVVDTELRDDEFRSLATESGWPGPAGTESLPLPFCLGVRLFCPPVLGLEPLAPLEEYLAQRRTLGASEANRMLLRSTGTSHYLLETR